MTTGKLTNPEMPVAWRSILTSDKALVNFKVVHGGSDALAAPYVGDSAIHSADERAHVAPVAQRSLTVDFRPEAVSLTVIVKTPFR